MRSAYLTQESGATVALYREAFSEHIAKQEAATIKKSLIVRQHGKRKIGNSKHLKTKIDSENQAQIQLLQDIQQLPHYSAVKSEKLRDPHECV